MLTTLLTVLTMKTLKQRQIETGRTLALNGKAWRDLRARVLAESPLCVICDARGLTNQATDVDHADNDPSNNSSDNLVSLCHECHSLKTQADLGKSVYWGCDVNGNPIDPNHPWNQKSVSDFEKDHEQPTANEPRPPLTFIADCGYRP